MTYEEMARRVELLAAKLQVEYLDGKGKQAAAARSPLKQAILRGMTAVQTREYPTSTEVGRMVRRGDKNR